MFRPSMVVFYPFQKVKKTKLSMFLVLIELVKPKSHVKCGRRGVIELRFGQSHRSKCENSLTYIKMLYISCIYCMIYVSIHFPSIFPCFSQPFSLLSCFSQPFSLLFLIKMLSLNHLSAFWNRRRYYETYIRYVTLGIICLHSRYCCLYKNRW